MLKNCFHTSIKNKLIAFYFLVFTSFFILVFYTMWKVGGSCSRDHSTLNYPIRHPLYVFVLLKQIPR